MRRRNLYLAIALLAACGGSARGPTPGAPPTATGGVKGPPAGGPAATAKPEGGGGGGGALRHVLVGAMCPDRGAGRPALAVLAARQIGWASDAETLSGIVHRMGERPFSVLAWTGKRAGVFTGLGEVDLGTLLPVVSGGYGGAAVCGEPDSEPYKSCAAALAGCGLAVASLAADGGDDAPALAVGGGCVENNRLYVDIDGDGAAESFAVAGFLDELRAPADEVVAERGAPASTCTAQFAQASLVAGKDQKAFRALDLLAVIDLDDDGRREIVMQYRYGTVTTWAIYATDQTAKRLKLAVEVVPWGAAD